MGSPKKNHKKEDNTEGGEGVNITNGTHFLTKKSILCLVLVNIDQQKKVMKMFC